MLRKQLMIGLGGAGGLTLRHTWLEIERRLHSVGWTSGMPDAFQFLNIDVCDVPEQGPPETSGVLEGAQHLLGLAHFPTMYQAHDAQLVAEEGVLPSLVGWRPNPETVNPEIWQGSGQRRAVGRVVALNHLDQVKQAMDQALTIMSTPHAAHELSAVDALAGNDLPPIGLPGQVTVVTSLGGGAGSGMILDVWDILAGLAFGDRAWLRDGVSVLFAPDVLPPSARGPGLLPNSLAAMSEFLAAFVHEGPTDEREAPVLEAAGIGTGHIRGRRSTPFNVLIGGRNGGGLAFASQHDAYRMVGRALGALATDVELQYRLDAHRVSAQGPAARLGIDPSVEATGGSNLASSFGYATLSLGQRHFTRYSAERLADATADRVLHAHVQRHGDRPPLAEDQMIHQRAEAVLDSFSAECGLPNADAESTAILDALRGEGGADFRQQLVGATGRFTEPFPPARWAEIVLAVADELEARFRSEVEEQRLRRTQAWVLEIQDQVLEATAQLMVEEGGPVAVVCLRLLDTSVEMAASVLNQEMSSLTVRLEQMSSGVETLVRGIDHPMVALDHPVLQEAVELAARWLQGRSEIWLRELVVPLLHDLRQHLLEPLRQAVHHAVGGLNQVEEEQRRGRRRVLWQDGEVPPHLRPAHHEVVLVDPEGWNQRYADSMVATFGGLIEQLGGGSTAGRQAEEGAIREVLTGAWPHLGQSTGNLAQDLIERRQDWVPLLGGVRAERRPQEASFSVGLDRQALLYRSTEWCGGRTGPIADGFHESIATHLDGGDPALVAERTAAFSGALEQALLVARPHVSVDQATVASVHPGHRVGHQLLMGPLPFGPSHPAYGPCSQLLLGEGVPMQTLPSYFHAVGAPVHLPSEPETIEIIRVLDAPLHPLVFDSFTADVIQAWHARSRSLRERESFWHGRRARSLTGFVPISNGGQVAMAAGWIGARLLNRVQLPKDLRTDQPQTVRIWSDGGWLDFPRHLLGPNPTGVSDILPRLFESIPLAMLGVAEGDRAALGAYAELSRMGESVLSLGGGPLRDWILDGVVPEGCPQPLAKVSGSALDSADDRCAAMLSSLTQMRTRYEELVALPVTAEFTLAPPGGWELAPLLLHSATRLQEVVDSEVRLPEDPIPRIPPGIPKRAGLSGRTLHVNPTVDLPYGPMGDAPGEAKQQTGDTLFISCTHREDDAAVATALVRFVHESVDLPRRDILCTADPRSGIVAGDWGSALRDRLRAARLGLILVTPHYQSSDYCKHEVGAMWALEVDIIPVLLDVSVEGLGDLLRSYQAFDLRDPHAPDRLVEAIGAYWPNAKRYSNIAAGQEFRAAITTERVDRAERIRVSTTAVAATRNKYTTDVAVLDSTGVRHLTRARRTGGAFAENPERVGAAVRCVGAGTHLPDTDHRELFAALKDGRMMHRRDWTGDDEWIEMTASQPATLVALHAVSPAPERFSLYAIDSEGGIWRTIWPGPGFDWHGWESLPPPVDDEDGRQGQPLIHLSAASNWPGGEDVFAIDRGGALWAGWSEPHGAPVKWWFYGHGLDRSRAMALVSRMEGHLECFVVDHRGVVLHRFRNPGGEKKLTSLQPLDEQPSEPLKSLAACSSHDGSQQLIGQGESGKLWQYKLWEDRWQGTWSEIKVGSN